jgi:uncharacterized protein
MNADNEEARSPEPIAADLTDAVPAPEPEPKPELSRDPTLVGPVAGEDRIFYIDLLRGLALFGILAANMRGFFAPLSVYENIKVLYPGMADRIAQAFIDIFIQGKFVTLFSFLFGLGFAVQMSRAEAKGVRFLSFYPRRLLALALFGVVHGIAIWAGDILLTYSIAGAVLLLFRNRKQKTVLRWAAVFPTLFFVGITVFFIAARFRHTAPDPPKPPDMARLQHIVDVYAHGSFLEIVRQNWIGWVGFSLPAQFAVLFVIYLFLLGLWVWRAGIIQRMDEYLPKLKRICAICLPLGIVLCTLETIIPILRPNPGGRPTLLGWFANILFIVALPTLSLGYATGLAVLIQNEAWKHRLRPFAAVGRMALTNYLLQSILCTLFFYHYTTGLYGKVGPALGLIPTVVLYGLQVPFSNWWLSRYRFGPMEWIWRGLTYGKLPTLRREPAMAGVPATGLPDGG